MTVYIYSRRPLKEDRGNLEDDLDELLSGIGQVTGGGAGDGGWNIDIEIDGPSQAEPLARILTFLRSRDVPRDCFLQVYEDDWREGDEIRRIHVYTA